jgi:hypothetical protein
MWLVLGGQRLGLRENGLRNRAAAGNLWAESPPAYPLKPQMLNRSAVVVRYRDAFRDWLRSIGIEEEEFEDHDEKSVYLISECEYQEDQGEVLQESAAAIFYEEVAAWHLAPKQHPDFNDFALFQSWFETEYFDMVADALEEPLVKEK